VAKIIWTHEAEQWLSEIFDYISLDNSKYAQKTVEGIYNKVQILSEFPEIGYKHERQFQENIRILL
jgi:plasmid stabilization system protein ParE